MPIGKVELSRLALDAALQEFSEYLQDRRTSVLRLTQAEMAARAGLNQSSVSRIEAGGRPRDKAATLAIATAYRLTRGETQLWLELLFGAPSVPMTDSEPWGESLERVYDLLERARPQISPPKNYITISSLSHMQSWGNWDPSFDAELTVAVDWTLADKHTLPRAHLLVELAGVFIHYLNERGYYRRRLALALAAADAAQLLESRTIEGWLRSDAIPWTLLTQRPNPAEASRQLVRGLDLAEELRHADMQATSLALLAWASARQRNMVAAEGAIGRALDIACAPAARLRVLWVAGDLATAQGQTEIAIAHYRLAEETDLAANYGHHTTVTATLRLSAAYARLHELGAARNTLGALLADRQAPLSAVRLARIYFDLAQLSRMENDYVTARTNAQRAVTALQRAEEDLRFAQLLRAFLAELEH